MANLSKAFKTFSLSPLLEEAILSLGFKEPTDVQKQAIPYALNGRDIVVSAQTGTGKTAAFSLPLIESLLHSPDKKALVLVPTREIGIQIHSFIEEVTKEDESFNSALIIGGVPLKKQEKQLAKDPRVIIASPGRLVDLMERKAIDLTRVGILVIDEADRLLDMGFTPQLNQIVSHLPIKRHTMLFSATIDRQCQAIANAYTAKAAYIEVGKPTAPPKNIVQKTLETTKAQKFDKLLDELNSRKGSVLIFAQTKIDVEHLFDELSAYAYEVKRIHGDRSQTQRSSAIKSLKTDETRILVATDVAARGIDIPSIEFVFNYDPPQLADDYIHRIGRTARAGASGEVLNFVTPENKEEWALILSGGKEKPYKRATDKRAPSKKKKSFGYRGKQDKPKQKTK